MSEKLERCKCGKLPTRWSMEITGRDCKYMYYCDCMNSPILHSSTTIEDAKKAWNDKMREMGK